MLPTKQTIKRNIKGALPPDLYRRANLARKWIQIGPAAAAFYASRGGPAYLPARELERLQEVYRPPERSDYSATTRRDIAGERAQRVVSLVNRSNPGASSILELGCGDGRTAGSIQAAGFEATGIDLRGAFTPDALDSGARLLATDAHALPFEDAAFDLVFSISSFEHFSQPERVFTEALRVLRPGGLLLLSFGPLYLAPLGLHAYRTVRVPYCQVLFERPVLDDFVARLKGRPIEWDGVNGWSVTDFRRLFDAHRDVIRKEAYEERRDISGAGLIRRYPSCFRDKSNDLDDFVVASIDAVFRKL